MKSKYIELILSIIMVIASGILILKDFGNLPSIIQSSCNVSSLINCNLSSHSIFSHLFGIPISLFGFLFSFYLLLTLSYTNNFEQFNKSFGLIVINACVSCFLFFASIFIIKSVCPYCFIYQICSFLLLYLLLKNNSNNNIKIKENIIQVFYFSLLITSIIFFNIIIPRNKEINPNEKLIHKILDSKIKVGDPLVDEKFWLIKTKNNFLDSKIHISIFSDFQCPACKLLSDNLIEDLNPYKDFINLQYINYPLDSSCNENMAIPMHPQSCLMSKIYICSPTKETYNFLFENQKWMTDVLLEEYIKEKKIVECIVSKETNVTLQNHINQGVNVSIEATPTIIINGIKFDGIIKKEFLDLILNYYINKK